jgi:hypothetical protein
MIDRRICSIEDCNEAAYCRGLCRSHYFRQRVITPEQRTRKNDLQKKRRQEDPDLRKRQDQRSIEWRKNNLERARKTERDRDVRNRINNPNYKEKPKRRTVAERNLVISERYRNDIQYALIHRLRCRTGMALKTSSAKKSVGTLALLGCTGEEFKIHIERQFLDTGMSWENRHEWDIDHIKPIHTFDLTDELQQRECFHYTNLRPLWAKDNRSRPRNAIYFT